VNPLTEIGEKIFLDRYAVKDGAKESISLLDTVIVCTNVKTGQREIGTVEVVHVDDTFSVRLRSGELVRFSREDIDKPLETKPEQMTARVAKAVAAIENDPDEWEERFQWLLDDWRFVPAGRILASVGTGQQLTAFNCYVLPSPKDSRGGIMETLRIMTEVFSRGGGVGMNISTLRPRFAYVQGVNGRSSGSVSWGALYSYTTGLIEQGGSRRGALMLILNVWHPDILEFINSKREAGKITNANISVGITDAFMQAVKEDADWQLVFPDTSDPNYDSNWDGDLQAWKAAGGKVIVYKTLKARELWQSIIESAWASAEPGLWFIDRSNQTSNSWYYNTLHATNPCGEQPLPDFGVCNLGAINLTKFVRNSPLVWNPDAFSGHNKDVYQEAIACVDWDELRKAIRYAVRFLDNIIDVTPYFFDENERVQKQERRIGLNTMGLAEMMIRVGIRYGSADSVRFIGDLYRFISKEAYLASSDIASEKGSFPKFNKEQFLQSGYMKKMPMDVRSAVHRYGIRNVTLLTQAPNGTIGTMVGTSTGIEPFYALSYMRKSRLGMHEEKVGVWQEWLDAHPLGPVDVEHKPVVPDFFVTAMDLSPEEHVSVQAAVQEWVDSSISKTCNLPNEYTVEQVGKLYQMMYDLGCKGGTIYRDGSRDEQVLSVKKEEAPVEDSDLVRWDGYEFKKADIIEWARKMHERGETFMADNQQPKIRPRPYKTFGATVAKSTPVGNAHITMNNDEDGEPLEIFVDVGKGGTDIRAMAEALGRLMSLVLRINSPLTPQERVQEIVDQMKGIGGASSVGFGKSKVRSLPDAVAIALEEHYGVEGEESEEEPVFVEQKPHDGPSNKRKWADICPKCGMAAYVRTEGCTSCMACGHSAC